MTHVSAPDVTAGVHDAQPEVAGLPGLRGLEHIGLCVPNLQEAASFFSEVLGWPVIYAYTPPSDPEGNFMTENFGLHPRAVVVHLAHVRSPLLNFELIEGTTPDQTLNWPRMLDIGGVHLAVYVDDVPAALAYLTARGCTPFGEAKAFSGPEAGKGAYFVHTRTPFGLHLELVSYPNGRIYHDTVSTKTWNPAHPDELARRALTT